MAKERCLQEGEQVEQTEAFCVSGWALLTGREARMGLARAETQTRKGPCLL